MMLHIIGMSAHPSEYRTHCEMVKAKYYQSKYRPVPTEESLVYENSVYPAWGTSMYLKSVGQVASGYVGPGLNPVRLIDDSQHQELWSPVTTAVIALAIETTQAGYSALVFCRGRQALPRECNTNLRSIPNIDNSLPQLD